jgi:hypothetical protein
MQWMRPRRPGGADDVLGDEDHDDDVLGEEVIRQEEAPQSELSPIRHRLFAAAPQDDAHEGITSNSACTSSRLSCHASAVRSDDETATSTTTSSASNNARKNTSSRTKNNNLYGILDSVEPPHHQFTITTTTVTENTEISRVSIDNAIGKSHKQ